MKKKWSIGAKIWFGFYILCQWVMCIEYATKPITAYNSAYQQATLIYGVIALVGTVLLLWLAVGHSRTALMILLVIAGVSAVISLIQGNVSGALLGLIMPGINWLIARNGVA